MVQFQNTENPQPEFCVILPTSSSNLNLSPLTSSCLILKVDESYSVAEKENSRGISSISPIIIKNSRGEFSGQSVKRFFLLLVGSGSKSGRKLYGFFLFSHIGEFEGCGMCRFPPLIFLLLFSCPACGRNIENGYSKLWDLRSQLHCRKLPITSRLHLVGVATPDRRQNLLVPQWTRISLSSIQEAQNQISLIRPNRQIKIEESRDNFLHSDGSYVESAQ